MIVDTRTFFLAAASLAAGGVGGYLVASRAPTGAPPVAPAPSGQANAQPGAAPAAAPPAPTCDDMTGAAEACPPPSGWPAEEGGCGSLPPRRCDDFKQTLKPRIAERAVACLNALAPARRCDARRIAACGHAALMSACAESPTAASAGSEDALGARCDAIALSCGGSPLAPTARDCRATLAGMTAHGRDLVAECMTAHCADRGLLGCEATTDVR